MSIYEALMGETGKGKGGEEADGLFWHENKCLWTNRNVPVLQLKWSLINGAHDFREPSCDTKWKKAFNWLQETTLWNGIWLWGIGHMYSVKFLQTWKLTNTLLCPSRALVSGLRRSCVREACAATECAVLFWRVVRELYIQTGKNYDTNQINLVIWQHWILTAILHCVGLKIHVKTCSGWGQSNFARNMNWSVYSWSNVAALCRHSLQEMGQSDGAYSGKAWW